MLCFFFLCLCLTDGGMKSLGIAGYYPVKYTELDAGDELHKPFKPQCFILRV